MNHATRATITVEAELEDRLKQFAQQTGKSVEEIADQALRAHLGDVYSGELAKENRAYERLHATLAAHYPKQFVAIYGGSVIDTDPDFETLYLRVRQTRGDVPVLIRRVNDTPQEAYRFRSPRLDQS